MACPPIAGRRGVDRERRRRRTRFLKPERPDEFRPRVVGSPSRARSERRNRRGSPRPGRVRGQVRHADVSGLPLARHRQWQHARHHRTRETARTCSRIARVTLCAGGPLEIGERTMWRAGRITLLLGIAVGGAVATWQIVDVRNDAGETVSTAENPLPTVDDDEPPLERLDASVVSALQSALPDAIRANSDIPASSSGVRLESDTARSLAESAALAEVADLGPVYGPDNEILGHSFGVPVPTGMTIRFTKPSPFTDEFLEIAPSLSGDRQMEVLGVATMVVAVAVEGTILLASSRRRRWQPCNCERPVAPRSATGSCDRRQRQTGVHRQRRCPRTNRRRSCRNAPWKPRGLTFTAERCAGMGQLGVQAEVAAYRAIHASADPRAPRNRHPHPHTSERETRRRHERHPTRSDLGGSDWTPVSFAYRSVPVPLGRGVLQLTENLIDRGT